MICDWLSITLTNATSVFGSVGPNGDGQRLVGPRGVSYVAHGLTLIILFAILSRELVIILLEIEIVTFGVLFQRAVSADDFAGAFGHMALDIDFLGVDAAMLRFVLGRSQLVILEVLVKIVILLKRLLTDLADEETLIAPFGEGEDRLFRLEAPFTLD